MQRREVMLSYWEYSCHFLQVIRGVDVWRSSTFSEKLQVSVLPITSTYRRTTEHSTSDRLGDFSWVQ